MRKMQKILDRAKVVYRCLAGSEQPAQVQPVIEQNTYLGRRVCWACAGVNKLTINVPSRRLSHCAACQKSDHTYLVVGGE